MCQLFAKSGFVYITHEKALSTSSVNLSLWVTQLVPKWMDSAFMNFIPDFLILIYSRLISLNLSYVPNKLRAEELDKTNLTLSFIASIEIWKQSVYLTALTSNVLSRVRSIASFLSR